MPRPSCCRTWQAASRGKSFTWTPGFRPLPREWKNDPGVARRSIELLRLRVQRTLADAHADAITQASQRSLEVRRRHGVPQASRELRALRIVDLLGLDHLGDLQERVARGTVVHADHHRQLLRIRAE